MYRFSAFIFLAMLCTVPAYGQLLVWQDLGGPNSSDVRDVAIAPNGNVFALVYSNTGTGSDNLYRRKNGSPDWELLGSSYDNPWYGIDVAPDGTVYMGTHFGIRRSTDDGETWADKTGTFGLNYKFLFGSPGLIVSAGFFNGKFTNNAYSTDNGETWQTLTPPETSGAYIIDLALDPLGVLYAATYRGGIRKSTDLGATWTAIGDTLTENTWFLFAHGNGQVTALADWRMLHSTDEGVTWSVPGADLGSVASCDAYNAAAFVAARTRDSVFITTNTGQTWEPFFVSSLQGNIINNSVIDPGGNVWMGTSMGLLRKSTAGGTAESAFLQDGPPILPSRLGITQSNLIFVSCPDYGMRTVDGGGMAWYASPLPSPIYEPPLSYLEGPNTVVALTRYAAYRTTNSGSSWDEFTRVDTLGFTRNTAQLSDGTIIAATNYPMLNPNAPGGLHIFNEQNPNWSKMRFHTDTVLALAADAQDRLFVSDGHAIWRTTDVGTTWQRVHDGEYDLMYAADDGTVYCTGYNGMWVSSDGGTTWTELPFQHPAQVVAMVKDAAEHLFVALNGDVPISNNGGVYASYDGGATWREEVVGMAGFAPTHRCTDMVLDRTGRLVVAVEDGVYRTSTPTAVGPGESPLSFALSPAYPNPVAAGGKLNISYSTVTPGDVTVRVYSLLGEVERTVQFQDIIPGAQVHSLSTNGLPRGIHYYDVRTPAGTLRGTFLVR